MKTILAILLLIPTLTLASLDPFEGQWKKAECNPDYQDSPDIIKIEKESSFMKVSYVRGELTTLQFRTKSEDSFVKMKKDIEVKITTQALISEEDTKIDVSSTINAKNVFFGSEFKSLKLDSEGINLVQFQNGTYLNNESAYQAVYNSFSCKYKKITE